jgi:hypothetical protein
LRFEISLVLEAPHRLFYRHNIKFFLETNPAFMAVIAGATIPLRVHVQRAKREESTKIS